MPEGEKFVVHGEFRYQVGKLVRSKEEYRIYLCKKEGEERIYLLQIASETQHNSNLDRNAFMLQLIATKAAELEAEYKAQMEAKGEKAFPLGYTFGFPEVVDSFICHEQGDRRVNVLAFRGNDDPSQIVPVSNIRDDGLRVDVKTSAWILGKLLKLLVFAHSEGIAVNLLDSNNILLDPDQHYTIIFDWSQARTNPGGVPVLKKMEEISNVARVTLTALGADPESEEVPNDQEVGHDQYIDRVVRLSRGSEINAQKAHTQFYELIRGIWPRGFHPFTTNLM